MLIHRCAWHRKTFGYVAYLRVTRDGRWTVTRSDGICRPCRDVMLATARGAAPKSLPITRELARAAMAVTGVVAWLLVMLLFAGCEGSGAAQIKKDLAKARTLSFERVDATMSWAVLCGVEAKPYAHDPESTMLVFPSAGAVVIASIPTWQAEIVASKCAAAHTPGKPLGRP